MARLCVTNREVIVNLTLFERVGSLYFGEPPHAPLAAVTSVSLVIDPSRNVVDETIVVPFLLGGLAFRPRSTIPRARTHEGGRASVVTWRTTPAVRVEFDRERSPWALFLISDPDAERIVRTISGN